MSMPTTHDEAPEGLAQQVGDLLVFAMDQRAEDVQSTLADIAEQYGDRGLYALTYAMADLVKLIGFDNAKGFAQIKMLGGRAPEDLPPEDRADLWAARFLAAHLNDDAAQRQALWNAELDVDRAVANVVALIWLTASVANIMSGGSRRG